MKSAFKKTLIAFLTFILLLIGILVIIYYRLSQGGYLSVSITDSMQMVNLQELLLEFLGASIFILISIVLTFWMAHAWAIEQPSLGERIIRLAMVVSLLLILVFGGLASGLIVLRTLQTVGYF